MTYEFLAPTVRDELNDVRDAFDAAWKAGHRGRIEAYLSARTEPERTVLFEMLLEVEVESRRKAGEQPNRAEYIERFEAYTAVIHTVFGEPRIGDETEPGSPATTARGPDASPHVDLATTVHAPSGRPDQTADLASWIFPERVGPYRLIRPLGRGNFEVYLASDNRDGRNVALKIAGVDDPSGRQRLMSLAQEAEKLKALSHPRIVKLIEYVPPGAAGPEADGYIALEYVEGQTLEQLFRAGPVPALRLTRIVALTAEAVHHAHTHVSGVVHRDLKPSNILLDLQDEPHVCDFGLAIDEEFQRTRRGEVAGTIPYMAPEQVRGVTHRLDGRTDIWAMGVILYQGLTGKLPFPGLNRDEIFEEILHRDPKPLRMHDPGIDPELERICLRCLSRPMADRYLNARDLAADLNCAAGGPARPAIDAPGAIAPKGLRPFDDEDSGFFLALLPGPRRGDGLPESVRFWKDRVEAIEGEKAFSVGVLYGPSGGGKSSFVKAGLLPYLDRTGVRPIYIEATPAGTEFRLLVELRRQDPTLPIAADLPGAIAALRDGRARRPAGKWLLVIDQFEQWLEAHSSEPDTELVHALRQCDGGRVQALVIVRDDFWMAVTRFLKAVDVPLVQGGNSAAVELFDVRHTRAVLERFGQALGKIPADGDPGALDTTLFLDEVAHDLAGLDGRVIPARLSLFAVVVRHRPWTLETLRALGGVDGIGVKFLDECFASAPYKLHRGAAQSVLKKLLPPPTSAIRGSPRSGSELRHAAGFADRQAEFTDLVRVLDGGLKLITSVDADSSTRSLGAPAELPPGEGREIMYQLAHDYLVRPIRQWLERDQRSTRQGRAKLRLELITASWIERQGPRQLPSPLELASILRYVASDRWAPDERRLMREALRRLFIRVAASAVFLAVLAGGMKFFRDRSVADSLLEKSLHVHYGNLPGMIPELKRYRELLTPGLLAQEQHGPEPAPLISGAKSTGLDQRHMREIAGILLFRFAPTLERATYLQSLLRADIEPDELESIRDALADHPDLAGIELLRALLFDGSAEPSARLRAACVLAKIDPEGARNREAAGAALKLALMNEDHRSISRWVELLGPTARALVPAMATDCGDPEADSAERTQVAEALAEILTRGQDALELCRVLVDAQPDSARILRRALATLGRREAAVGYLGRVLDERTADADAEDRKDKIASRRAEASITLAVLGDVEPLWPLLAHRPDPRLRTRLIHTVADSGLDPHVLLDRLNRPGLDAAQRQALLLALAEAQPSEPTLAARAGFVDTAGNLYQHDPDPGVHSAVELLLRRWEREDVTRRTVGPPPAGPELADKNGRRWEKGPNGHTLAILPGPLEFWMGSPVAEDGRSDSEQRHYRRIDRSIAVATMEVTARQFRASKVNPDYHPEGRGAREPGVVANMISWHDAAGYCNWLSDQAKIPPEQWCYPTQIKVGAKIEAGALKKCGYRLPTEAEWEYFCRAGTETSRAFGGSDAFLLRYAWTWLSSEDRTHPPGQLLPNELGLFDTLGNVLEWCQDGPMNVPTRYQDPYPSGSLTQPAPDVIPDVPKLQDGVWRYLRGGSYEESPFKSRSAFRDEGPPDMGKYRWGFRVVRTLPANRP
jgi:eukaryotic-like serine/threonine-protein kinase